MTADRDQHMEQQAEKATTGARKRKKAPQLMLITSHGKILVLTKCRGGLVKDGLDGGGYHLMETRAGLNALKVFAQVGQMQPLYISQQFFDSVEQA